MNQKITSKITLIHVFVGLSIIMLISFNKLIANNLHTKNISKPKDFVENKGQFRDQHGNPNPEVLYMADFGGMKVLLRKDGFSYETYQVKPKWVDPASIPYKVLTITDKGDTLESWPGMEEANKKLMYHYHRVDVKALGANPGATLVPENATGETTRYIFPKEKGLAQEVKTYGQIRVSDLYPGIDIVYYADHSGEGFKYDILVHPHGIISELALEYEGANSLLLENGNLQINTSFGILEETIPLCYVEDDHGTKMPIEDFNYLMIGNTVKITGDYQPQTQGLVVIDPAVNTVWGTYLGGSADDYGAAVKTDSLGFIYVCGNTSSTNNISTSGVYQDSLLLPYDGFLTKFTNLGQQIWGTYLNGFSANDMDVSNNLQLAITGDNGIVQFNTEGMYLWSIESTHYKKGVAITNTGNIIAVGDSAIKIATDGSVVWRMRIWDEDSTVVKDICSDANENIYFAGRTWQRCGISTDGTHQRNYHGSCGTGGRYINVELGIESDGFIIKCNTNGSKIWGTYYGGNHYDEINSIDCHDTIIAVAGMTNSLGSIASLDAEQANLTPQELYGRMIICFGENCCGQVLGYFCGLPLIGCVWHDVTPYDSIWQAMDGFLACFNTKGQRIWGTYTGEYEDDYYLTVKVAKNGEVYAGGTSMGVYGLIPTTYSYKKSAPAGSNPYFYHYYPVLFTEKYNSLGVKQWGTYNGIDTLSLGLGIVTFNQNITDIDKDESSNTILLTGYTPFQTSMGTNNGFQSTNQGGYDAFLQRFAEADFDLIAIEQNMNPCYGTDTAVKAITQPYDSLGLVAYKWMHNSTNLEGENQAEVVLNSIQATDNGYYKCKITKGEFSWITDSVLVASRDINTFNQKLLTDYSITSMADMNNDGQLDLLGEKLGLSSEQGYTNFEFEPGNNVISSFPIDINSDNQLDLVVCTGSCGSSSTNQRTKIYTFLNGELQLYDSVPEINGNCLSNILSGDFDNDGDFDVIAEYHPWNMPSGRHQNVYENNQGVLVFRCSLSDNYPVDLSIIGGLSDIDRDGDIDITKGRRVFWNDGGFLFSPEDLPANGCASPEQVWYSTYDINEDAILEGIVSTSGYNYYCGPLTPIEIFSLVNHPATLQAIIDSIPGSHIIGDFNNDGHLDILSNGGLVLMGNGLLNANPPQLLINSEMSFVKQPTSNANFVTGVFSSISHTADYDNDGDLDLFSGNSVFENSMCNVANSPPGSPNGLNEIILNDTVHFTWQRATDVETNQLGLTYNIRIGTTPGGTQISSPMSDSTGWRKLVGMGNVYQNTEWPLKLPEGDYYWSVQAIDNHFSGGAFAPEQHFQLWLPPTITQQPSDYFGCPNDTVTLQIQVEHHFPVSFQWYFNDTPLVGETDSLLVIISLDSSNTGQYYCKVSNGVYTSCTDTVNLQFRDWFLPGITYPALMLAADYDKNDNTNLFENTLNGTEFTDKNRDGVIDIVSSSDSVKFFSYINDNWTQLQCVMPTANKVLCKDMDNDGDIDYLLTRWDWFNSQNCYNYLIQETDSNYLITDLGYSDVQIQSISVVDIENDLDYDIVFSGWRVGWYFITKLLKNQNGVFTEQALQIPGLYGSSMDWGDYDNDGDLDLLINGSVNFTYTDILTKVYKNTGGTLIDAEINLIPEYNKPVKWLDLNNDGYLDIQIGNSFYHQNNGVFIHSIQQIPQGTTCDFDDDGDWDILSDEIISGFWKSILYVNNMCISQNSIPSAPEELTTNITGDKVFFNWNHATDSETPWPGLFYNLRVGTTQGGCQVVSPLSNASGYRQCKKTGNTQQNLSWWLKLAPDTYYWSVQAIDNSLAGGQFAPEQSFTIPGIKIKVFPESLLNLATGLLNKAHNASGEQFAGNVADVLTIELHEAVEPYACIGNPYTANLLTNGFASFVPTQPLPDQFYVVVKHRNHVETWSSVPVSLNNGYCSYDFTQQLTSAFGHNLRQLEGVYGLFAGDVNQDGVVDALDHIMVDNQAAQQTYGYLPEDLNGDGIVNLFDVLILDNNAKEFVKRMKP
jgi:hypothetical protein